MKIIAASIFAIIVFSLASVSIAGNILVARATENRTSEGTLDSLGQTRTSTSLLSGISVAVLNETVSPSYFSGSLGNDYTSVITTLTAQGASVTALTSSQIASGALVGYDVFIMVDNAPSATCQSYIRDAWMAGTAIMAFDSSICALCYFGILPACSSGSNGQGTYWTYGDTSSARVKVAHPITANYSVGATVSGSSGDAYWYSSAMSGVSEYSRITVLTDVYNDADKWTTILYEPASYAPVFFCWDQAHLTNTALKPIIVQAVKYLAGQTNRAPTLTAGYVSPMAGSTSTAFTFTVTYADVENAAPAYVRVVIGGYTLGMSKQSYDVDYRDGCIYQIITTLPAGSYTYHFEASDGHSNVSTPEENGPYVNTSPPTSYLSRSSVTPASGFTYDSFFFQVTYTHAGNVAPSGFYMMIDGSYYYPMFKLNPSDNVYTDGCVYYYSVSLAPGSHSYSFQAYDGSTTIYSPTYTGLAVTTFASTVSLSQASCSPASGGDTYTNFQFRVQYTQPSNIAPDFVWVYIDGKGHQMSVESSWDTTYDDGCFYIYSTQLGEGSHTYYFNAGRSGDSLSTNPSSMEVQKGSNFGDSPSLFTVLFIALGSVATISTISYAHKIKAKKGHTTPLHSNAASTIGYSPRSVNARGGSSSSVPAQGGWGSTAGRPIPTAPGFLPPSAFVREPIDVPFPPSPTNQDLQPTAVPLGPSHSSAPEPLLPGSPKWMRLARYDISMYTAPPEENDANAQGVEENLAAPDIDDGARIEEEDIEYLTPEDDAGIESFPSPDLVDDKLLPVIKPATLVVRRPLGEGLPSSKPEAGKPHVAICPSCKKEIAVDGHFDGILYDCNKCNQRLVYTVICDACRTKTEIPQEEWQKARGSGIRCPVCWETTTA